MGDIKNTFFNREKVIIQDKTSKAEAVVALNVDLKKYNWLFIHPHTFGYEYEQLKNLANNTGTTKEHITEVFAKSFYDFRTTALFLDGDFKNCPYIKPFCQLVDQAVILAVQKDYAGAINILIPVIEGCIRNYLVQEKGKINSSIMKTEDLLKVFGHLENAYCDQCRITYIERNINLHKGQIDKLISLERKYIKLWFDIIKAYFNDNLYLDTRVSTTADTLNRHVIIHAFTDDVYYNLGNFLKVFNTLLFMGWAFRMSDFNMKSHFSMREEDIYYKWKALEKLKFVAELTAEIKCSVYEKYPDFSDLQFKQTIQVRPIFDKYNRIKPIDAAFKFIDEAIDKKMNI